MESHRKGSRISSPRSCQFYGFYAFASSLRDACTFHLVLASKEDRQRPHNCHTVWAGALGQELSRRMVLSGPTFPEYPTDTPGSGTAGHITSWAPGDRPLPCCCPLYRVSRKQASELGNQYDWGASCWGELQNSLEAPADNTWNACVKQRCSCSLWSKRGHPSQRPHFQAAFQAHPVDTPSWIPQSFFSRFNRDLSNTQPGQHWDTVHHHGRMCGSGIQ